MFATYIAWSLIMPGMPYWGAFFITVAFAFVFGVVIERVVIRPVENAPVLAVVVIFIALLVILNSVTGWIYTIRSRHSRARSRRKSASASTCRRTRWAQSA
jgi:branched-chain amino acid transport system permease protein